MKINKKLGALAVVALATLPFVAFAQDTNLTTLTNMATGIRNIINILIPVVFGLGILAFFWGLVRYLFGSEHDKEQAKKTMLWGVIAIFIMASIWGLVRFLAGTFGVQNTPPTQPGQVIPTI
ncbi:MAG TPA: pilin [Candidatus Paceibacterota bacterium]